MIQTKNLKKPEWLLFFYSVPSRPVSSRVKIWRKLAKAGALPLKGAVYLLPNDEENFEYLQWLVSEVTSRGGEADFVRAEKIQTMRDKEIIDLFNRQRERDYRRIETGVDEIQRKIDSIEKGSSLARGERLLETFRRLIKEFEEIRKIDFFSAPRGNDLREKMKIIEPKIIAATSPDGKKQQPVIAAKRVEDYKGKTWVTRKNPFVDRMATAWLIKRFIDEKAIFQFMDEKRMENLGQDSITFDVRDGEFTHTGDMCTFEVFVKTFKFKDKTLKKVAEIVHELDVKDERFRSPESRGIEEILIGIRKIAKSDKETLERGMAIFEMLYAAKV